MNKPYPDTTVPASAQKCQGVDIQSQVEADDSEVGRTGPLWGQVGQALSCLCSPHTSAWLGSGQGTPVQELLLTSRTLLTQSP